MTNNLKSYLFVFVAVLFWSTVPTAFKLTLEGLTPEKLLLIASFTSTIALFFISLYTSKYELLLELKGKYIFKNSINGLINPFIYYLILFEAYSLLPAQEAQPLNQTWAIEIAIFSVIFLKEKLSFKIIFGLLISFSGVWIISTRGNVFGLKFENPLGVSLALLSSLIWAIYWIINIKDKRTPAVKLFGSFFIATIYILIYNILFSDFKFQSLDFVIGAIYIGLFEMGITFYFWMKSLVISESKTKTSTLIYLAPFISLIFVNLILKEKILYSSVIGLILIVLGILIQQIKKKEISELSSI
ncbi:MAG: DMT family transporter [Ignavibacteriales bacterium]|nr:DMT family transporter [Ignavibacteriales bacterium]